MKHTRTLTDRQRDIYNFIIQFIQQRGYSPSFTDIKTAFDIVSWNGVTKHIKALKRKGYLVSVPGHARTFQPTNHSLATTPSHLPIMKVVGSGKLIEEDNPYNFTTQFCNPDYFVMKAQGSQMVSQHILSGDYLVLRKVCYRDHESKVIARIKERMYVCNYYLVRENWHQEKWYVESLDGKHKQVSVLSEDVKVLGVLIGVLRKCKKTKETTKSKVKSKVKSKAKSKAKRKSKNSGRP